MSTLTRVPGNRAHVDLLFQKFDEDANIDFDSLDIAVNAVATAVKDFFFKVGGYYIKPNLKKDDSLKLFPQRLPPLLPAEHMADLEQVCICICICICICYCICTCRTYG